MRTTRCLAMLLVALTIGVATASAEPITHYVVFGDSLSDVGNVYAATGGAEPAAPYWQGRFSNGPIWIERRAELHGLPVPTPSVLGGTNYAFGGAETGLGMSADGTPNLLTQAALYLGQNTPTGSEQFVIWGGANDVLATMPATNLVQTAENISQLIGTLADAGGENFLVMNMPPLGETPLAISLGPAFQTILNAMADNFNTVLLDKVEQLRDERNLAIEYVDTYGAMMDFLDDPAAHGFTNVTDPAFDDATGILVDTPNDYLFFDGVHPTAHTHELLATIPEPSTLVLLAMAAIGACIWRRRRP